MFHNIIFFFIINHHHTKNFKMIDFIDLIKLVINFSTSSFFFHYLNDISINNNNRKKFYFYNVGIGIIKQSPNNDLNVIDHQSHGYNNLSICAA